MPRSLLDQLSQIRGSGTYDGAVASAETVGVAEGQTSLQGDMNILRTQLANLKGETNWYDTPERTLKQVNDRQIQDRKHTAGMENVASGTGLSSYVFDAAIKSISGHNSGLGDSVTDGVVVDATLPNAVKIRDYDTQDAINDGSGNDVYGRLSYDTAVFEENDQNNQLSGYSSITGIVKGQVSGNNTDVQSKHYINIVDDGGGFFHVDIYKDAARTQLVGHTASYNATGSQAVIADNASGLGGTITIDAVTAADSDIAITHGRYLLTWYSWVTGVETAYNFISSVDLEVASVIMSIKAKDLPWDVYRTGEFHDVSGISGSVADDAIVVDGMTDLLVGLTTQGQVNAKLDDLGTTNSGEGASLIGIEDLSGYFTGTNIEVAFNELESQLGGDTSGTYAFAEDNVLADNDAVFAALNKLDLKWGDLASVANGEGASLVGSEDVGGYFTGTDVEAILQEIGVSLADISGVKVQEVGVGPITAETAHTIPGGNTYTVASGGQNMDVYVNGQLMTEDEAGSNDYDETSTTQVTFHFTIPANSNIIYIIRK